MKLTDAQKSFLVKGMNSKPGYYCGNTQLVIMTNKIDLTVFANDTHNKIEGTIPTATCVCPTCGHLSQFVIPPNLITD